MGDKQNDKDGGIRHQKVDQCCPSEFGCKNFDQVVSQMCGYKTVEDFILHCGPPQIKLAKHKTTGKGIIQRPLIVYFNKVKQEKLNRENGFLWNMINIPKGMKMIEATQNIK